MFVPGLTMSAGIMLAAFGFMILLGLATGLVPALNAFRLRIAEAMGRG
jgi:putative ABC transport system permease protein